MTPNHARAARTNWRKPLVRGALVLGGLVVFTLMIILPGYVGYREIVGLGQQQQPHSGYNPTQNSVEILGSAPSFAEAQGKHATDKGATCDHPRYREDADLCAQWEAVEAVTRGNVVALANLRSSIVAVLSTNIGVLLTAVGLVIATLASRDAARAVRAMESLERGYIDVSVTPMPRSAVKLTLTNIGRTPIWLLGVADARRGKIAGQDIDGIHCIRAEKTHVIDIDPAAGANPGLLDITVEFRDVLDEVRVTIIELKMIGDDWLLHDVREQRAK